MWQIALLTFTSVASIGPTNLLAIKEGFKHGFSSTFFILFGGVLVDALYAHIAGLGLSTIGNNSALQVSMLLIGFLVFSYLGILGIKNAVQNNLALDTQQETKVQKNHPLFIGVIMTLPNPFTILMWATAFSNFHIVYQPFYLTAIILFIGILWSAIEGFIVQFFKRYIKNTAIRVMELLTSFILLGFAVHFLLKAISFLIPL